MAYPWVVGILKCPLMAFRWSARCMLSPVALLTHFVGKRLLQCMMLMFEGVTLVSYAWLLYLNVRLVLVHTGPLKCRANLCDGFLGAPRQFREVVSDSLEMGVNACMLVCLPAQKWTLVSLQQLGPRRTLVVLCTMIGLPWLQRPFLLLVVVAK